VKRYPYIIVGASSAGLSAAEAIRSRDSTGQILLIHGENRLPYKRTQLSKQMARGFSREELAIHPAEWYPANRIELLQGIRALSLKPSSRELLLSTDELTGYESILIATGAAPVPLDVPGSHHIHYLRWIDQAETMHHRLKATAKAVSIGFGVQGIELADQFASAGTQAALLGRQDMLMDDCLDLEASQRLEKRIAAAGVRVLRWGKILEVRETDRGYHVVAERGEIDAGLVSASVGATSVIDLAVSAGLPLQNNARHGIRVGRDMKTGVEGIYAAGDAAAPLPGASWGLWHSAETTGMIAGVNMAGGDMQPEPRPRRLKTEAFGGYLFSLNYRSASLDDQAETRVICNKDALYLRIWEREGRSIAAVLDAYPTPGPSQAKLLGRQLERLILEGAAAKNIAEALGI
jgi:3-phenylpropionate/trans-cinnamate dioxygenase ferredoxin reductase component